MKLTIIGSGNMGGAIANGLTDSSIIKTSDITCSDLSRQALDKIHRMNPSIHTTSDNKEAVKNADLIVIAVKPWLLKKVCDEIKPELDCKRQIVISVVAGVTFEQLSQLLNNGSDVPVMFRLVPNTAIDVRSSMTFIAAQNAADEQINLIVNIFNELGSVMFVEERLIVAGTALASCGIAYAFRYIHAAIEGGVELGFYPEEAQNIVLQTLQGAIHLLKAKGTHPEEEINKITTPGGITIKGLNEMEHAGFTSAVIKGIKAGQ
ncbi:MAG: pyrroline-5-carboxylate reductase [Tannerella sp.]|jgi:pyrroline-5-carboxylate reductase|nr:pyrroline-5-carboxylate reductase [Tannerella sp.]